MEGLSKLVPMVQKALALAAKIDFANVKGDREKQKVKRLVKRQGRLLFRDFIPFIDSNDVRKGILDRKNYTEEQVSLVTDDLLEKLRVTIQYLRSSGALDTSILDKQEARPAPPKVEKPTPRAKPRDFSRARDVPRKIADKYVDQLDALLQSLTEADLLKIGSMPAAIDADRTPIQKLVCKGEKFIRVDITLDRESRYYPTVKAVSYTNYTKKIRFVSERDHGAHLKPFESCVPVLDPEADGTLEGLAILVLDYGLRARPFVTPYSGEGGLLDYISEVRRQNKRFVEFLERYSASRAEPRSLDVDEILQNTGVNVKMASGNDFDLDAARRLVRFIDRCAYEADMSVFNLLGQNELEGFLRRVFLERPASKSEIVQCLNYSTSIHPSFVLRFEELGKIIDAVFAGRLDRRAGGIDLGGDVRTDIDLGGAEGKDSTVGAAARRPVDIFADQGGIDDIDFGDEFSSLVGAKMPVKAVKKEEPVKERKVEKKKAEKKKKKGKKIPDDPMGLLGYFGLLKPEERVEDTANRRVPKKIKTFDYSKANIQKANRKKLARSNRLKREMEKKKFRY